MSNPHNPDECCGYDTWETFNVAVWASNDEDFYNAVQDANVASAEECEELAEQLFGGTETSDGAQFDRVDWDEIYAEWSDDDF